MPRADPTRSAYCASRHLLRNLDDPAELRRNPLVRECFAPASSRRDAAENGRALEAVRGLVHASLVECRERPAGGRARTDRGRMHAALLRCELDKQPLSVVAAELGLSDRQVRRERRAAHDAFLDAFGRSASGAPGAVVRDTAALHLAEAAELHELGRGSLAQAACASIAASAPQPDRRIEALCLAAEIDLDAARYAAACARLAEASAILAMRACELDESTLAAAAERMDLAAWSLRRATGVSGGLATPPPLAVARAHAGRERDEPRRALLVRALAAYAGQRADVGDASRCSDAVRRAQALLPALDPSRAKERLALMHADAQFHGLLESGAERDRFLAVERLATQRGYVRTMMAARAERIGSDFGAVKGGERVFEHIVRPFDPGDRRTMPSALAEAARVAAQCERDPQRALSAAHLAERLMPARSATALFARCMRVSVALARGRHDEASALAYAIHADAELLGNGRLRGTAARDLASVALARRRHGDAVRYIGEALPLLERYGTHAALAQAKELARELGAG